MINKHQVDKQQQTTNSKIIIQNTIRGKQPAKNQPTIQELGLKINDDLADVIEINHILEDILEYPSIQSAQIHQKALKLGNFDMQLDKTESAQIYNEQLQLYNQQKANAKICPCCQFIVQQQSLKLCTSFNKINNIGTSTFLYFYTYKIIAARLAIMIIIYSTYALITNIIAANQFNNKKYTVDYLTISLSSKQINDTEQNRQFYLIQCWLGFAMVLVQILIYSILQIKQILYIQQYDRDTISCSDYSIVIQDLPMDVNLQQLNVLFKQYYNQLPNNQKLQDYNQFKIAKINIGRPFFIEDEIENNKQLNNVKQKIQKAKDQFVEWMLYRKQSFDFKQSIQKRTQKYHQYSKLLQNKQQLLNNIYHNYLKNTKNQQEKLTTAFVSFVNNQAADKIVALNQKSVYNLLKNCLNTYKFKFKRGQKIYQSRILNAPQPQDIIWKNIGLQPCDIIKRKLITFFITFILLGLSFGAIYGLNQYQQQYSRDTTNLNSRYLSIAISIIITVVNIVLGQSIRYLTKLQRDYTITNYQTSLVTKSLLAQITNSILIPIIIAYYIKQNIYAASGLADQIFMMSVTNSFIGPILVLVDIPYIIRKVMIFFKNKPQSKLKMTQTQLNQLYEGAEFQVGFHYVYMVNLYLYACFYVSLQPICSFIAILGIFVAYWIEKYLLFQRFRRPTPGSDILNKAVGQFIQLGCLVYSLGSLTWSNFMPDGLPKSALIPNLCSLVFSILFLISPLYSLFQKCFLKKNEIIPAPYQQSRLFFSSQYDRINPATRSESFEQYEQYRRKRFKQMQDNKKKKQILKQIQNNAFRGQMILNLNQRQNQLQIPNLQNLFRRGSKKDSVRIQDMIKNIQEINQPQKQIKIKANPLET